MVRFLTLFPFPRRSPKSFHLLQSVLSQRMQTITRDDREMSHHCANSITRLITLMRPSALITVSDKHLPYESHTQTHEKNNCILSVVRRMTTEWLN